MAGTNDLKRRTAPEIASSLEQLHATCHAAGTRTLALGIPHSKASTVGSRGRSERRREVNACMWLRASAEDTTYSGYTSMAIQVNEWLRAYAARSDGWCDFYEPGSEVMQWAAGSSYFEVDGLHLTRSGYALLALLLLRGRTLRDFLTKHKGRATTIPPSEISLREISLPEITDAEAALRRRMRGWMEQYRVAVDAVQDQVFDVQMAKASREELEALHRVLQAEGLAGLTAAAEALELEALHRALLEGGQRGLDAAVRATTHRRPKGPATSLPSLYSCAPGEGDAEGEEGRRQGEAPRSASHPSQAGGRGQARPDGLRAPGRCRPHGSGETSARGARPPCDPLRAPCRLALV